MHGSTIISDVSTAADQTRAGNVLVAGLTGIPGVNGQGIGIAIVDSGIAPHSALSQRVVANVSFITGDSQVTDEFGHGTHVAGIIAGSAAPASGVAPAYTGGIAPGASLVNVRVLSADGSGYTSDVIAGIQWVVANRALYNIRVINLSLGHPVMEACATDPLCEAVNQAVQAGIVVVVAAGNTGRVPDGRTVLGSVSSPGNSPYAITIGALNTWGTADRSDDTVAAYSSRGPTVYDRAVKPDIVAPGTKILSLQADGALLPAMYPLGSRNVMLIAIRSPPTVLTLTADDVHVWHVDPTSVSDPGLIRRHDALMSPDERARHARFVFPRDQHIYLVARALVRTTLSKYADVEPQAWMFLNGAYGRPEIAWPPGGPPLRFSLSHTAGLVALAVTLHADVGIDVEGINARAPGLDIARQYFAPAEAAALEALPAEQQGRAFLEYWTLKEAYIKATGLGLSMPLKSFAFELADPPAISFNGSPGGDPSEWHFFRLELAAQHLSAMAVRSARRPQLRLLA